MTGEAAAAAAGTGQHGPTPDGGASATIFHGGRLLGLPVEVDAVLVVDGRIADITTAERASALVPSATRHDLGGALISPAFTDAHVHAVQTGLVMAGLALGAVTSRDQVLDAVRRATRERTGDSAAPAGGGRVLVGQGWDERDWPDPRPPTRAELDRAAPGVAVYLARVDVHSAVVSTALLEQLPDVRGLAGYAEDGLLSRDAHHAVRGQLDRLIGAEERDAAALRALQVALTRGIAAVHELGGPHLGPAADLDRVSRAGARCGVDVVTYWGELAVGAGGRGALEQAVGVGAAGLAGDLCIDGAIGSRTAALHQDYADAASRGARYLGDREIAEHVVACTRAGLQAGFHAIGDDAVAAAVGGFRRAAEVLGPQPIRAARHRIEHLEMLDPADVATLADLQVIGSVQPAFDAAWGAPGQLYEQRLGRHRAAGMNPFGALHRAGVPLAFGSDAPVTPLDGWGTVRAAVLHHDPDQRMPIRAAFAAATSGARWAGFQPAADLAVGQPATFAVWSVGAGESDADGLPRLADGAPDPAWRATVHTGRVMSGDIGCTT